MESKQEQEYTKKIKKSILAIQKLKTELSTLKQQVNEPIAITGMACRYPGGIHSPAQFWEVLKNGTDTIQEIPDNRWKNSDYYDSNPNTRGKTYVTKGGFIENIDKFDNQFFGVSEQEALYMDPQQRILLEVSCEAIENAAIDIKSLENTDTGVFIGITNTADYARRHFLSNNPEKIEVYSITGYTPTSASGRISFLLGLQGPNIALDTGCSSSLVSVHLACQSLRSGESSLALAGGVNALMAPHANIGLSYMSGLSKSGHCKTFDQTADGFIRSEGCGMLVLKKLSDAKRDNDNIIAIIRSSLVNNDGRSNGFTAPNSKAQEKLIKQTLNKAKLQPGDISYLEAHGTGTIIGDPIELEALKNTYANINLRNKNNMLHLGSVKTNLGHTEGAAGVAGILKVVLAIQNKKIPPNLHFQNPSKFIDWHEMAVKVPTKLTDWSTNGTIKRGAVSAFGISGTNAHLIIEEAPEQKIETPACLFSKNNILAVSTNYKDGLFIQAEAYKQFIQERTDLPLAAICANSLIRKSHHSHRITFAGNSRKELIQKLTAFAQKEMIFNDKSADFLNIRHKTAMVFPGQGSQWIGMGRKLFAESDVFKKHILACEKALMPHTNWKLTDMLLKENDKHIFDQIKIVQPVLFSVELALAKLWEHLGIYADAYIGHSMGEIAAACSANVLSLDEAALLISVRSSLLQQLSESEQKGRMLYIEVDKKKAAAILKPFDGKISLAVNNSPNSHVLSGKTELLEELSKELDEKNIFNKFVKVNIASHSYMVEPVLNEMRKKLKTITPHKAAIPIYSTVLHKKIQGEEMDIDYWIKNLRDAVMFSDTIQLMVNEKFTNFIEISPHPILTIALEQNFEALNNSSIFTTYTLYLDKDEINELLSNLGNLYIHHYPVDWSKIYQGNISGIALPAYPWQHKSFWLPWDEEDAQPQVSTKKQTFEQKSFFEQLVEISSAQEKMHQLEEELKKVVAKVTGTPIDKIDVEDSFKETGVDSLMAIHLSKILEELLEIKLSPATFWSYPSIRLYVSFLIQKLGLHQDSKKIASMKENPDIDNLISELDSELEDILK